MFVHNAICSSASNVCLMVRLNVFICNSERHSPVLHVRVVTRALCVVCISREDFITPFGNITDVCTVMETKEK